MMNAACSLVLLLAQTPQAPAADEQPIRNFLKVSPEFCSGGQPRPEHFARLRADGVKSVLNLRTTEEHRASDEQAAAERAGLKYFNVPVVFTAPQEAQVDEFLRLTDAPENRPMFVHCAAAVRVGAFFLVRRVVRDGWGWDAALAEARKIGLVHAPHLEEFAKRYVDSHPK
jgi:protein tyrosine phosphatase (PTP) superfamily phosphohydrolase (DUF442 family)